MNPIANQAERVRVVAPLGLRFWDPAFNQQVTDGLDVVALGEQGGEPRLAAYRTHSGIYAFRGLPGLHSAEYPQDEALPASPPLCRRFLIEITDRLGRFLPTRFRVTAPFSGVFPTGLSTGSPAQGTPGLFLFSAPTRIVPPGMAVIRAQLAEAPAHGPPRPAAHAVLEIYRAGSLLQLGIADPQGSVAVCLPYPTFVDSSLSGAGSSSPPARPVRQSWELSVRVRFEPRVLPRSPGAIPELRGILRQAPALFLLSSHETLDPPTLELAAELVFGQELVLRMGADARLFLRPSSTSP